MKLGIRLNLTGLSLLETVSILERLGVNRHGTTVHRWVQKADLQPTDGANPNHVAVDETVIQLNSEQYWLYAAVYPDINACSTFDCIRRERTPLPRCFSRNCVRNIRLTMWSFSSTVLRGYTRPVIVTGSDSNTSHMGIGMPSNVSFEK